MSKRIRGSFLAVTVAASLVVGVCVGFWMPQDDDLFELRKNFRIFGAVYEELVSGYVEPVDPEHLMRVGIEAMLDELDPYTTFLDEADNANLNIITNGRYGGVGLNIGSRRGKVTVIAPIEGASGYRKGVRAGDVITHINGQPTAPLSLDDVQTLLRGEPGTTVQISVRRAGAPEPLTFSLTREQVDLENVTYSGVVGTDGDVGYVKVERFTRDAATELASTLRTLEEGNELEGLVLDLRDNPGGLLNAAVQVSELFVPKGAVVVSTKGRLPDATSTYRSDRVPLFPDLPLVVLVNGYSASASEIVAGAVQDHDRGVVMGTTTYGKGLVQAVRSLPHNTSLKMTTAQYYTPSGRSIQALDVGKADSSVAETDTSAEASSTHETAHGRTVRDGDGITPDVHVTAQEPGALEKALQRRAAFFYYANHFAASRDTLAENFAVTDAILEDFRSWLRSEDIQYPTSAEHAVEKLQGRLDEEEYEEVRDELEVLRKAVKQEKMKAFRHDAADLKRHLKSEILARFVSESRKTEEMLPHDRQVTTAVDLLHEDERYTRLLTPADTSSQ